MLRANQAFVASQPNPYTNQFPYGNSMYDPTNAGVNQYPPQSGPFPRSTNWYEGGYNMQTAYAPVRKTESRLISISNVITSA